MQKSAGEPENSFEGERCFTPQMRHNPKAHMRGLATKSGKTRRASVTEYDIKL